MSEPRFDLTLAELADSAARAAQPQPAGSIRHRAQRRIVRQRATGALLAAALIGGGAFAFLHAPSDNPSPPGGDPTPSATSSGTAGCILDQLAITFGEEQAGSGHRSVAMIFRNTGTTTCRLNGYPALTAHDAFGTQLAQAEQTPRGYLGGLSTDGPPPTVDLMPGESASALVETLGFNLDGTSCTPYASVRVTLAQTTGYASIDWTSDGCSTLEVHPIAPGIDG